MEYIDFLNKNAGAFTVVFTAIVTLSTVVYAFLTARLATETKRMREVQTEPKIHIKLENFDFMTNIFRLNIQNIGIWSSTKFKNSKHQLYRVGNQQKNLSKILQSLISLISDSDT
ncbi:MAG: hypothetical protein U5K55_06260 [Aliarcobacter sp.]|nr:hypothetical protein [Aliarcobacter sp.]